MIPLCLILGDSTAVGTADALAAQGMRCAVHAREGAPSIETVKTWHSGSFSDRALIALGSNDALNPDLAGNLQLLRQRVSARRVTWLAPYHRRAAAIVSAIAEQFGDSVVHLGRFSSADGIHPKSYRTVASALQWQTPAPLPYRYATARSSPAPVPKAEQAIRRAVVMTF
ncbi:hypothetical protein QLH51_12675 [Sphingomonas sp. 2R-10]|uniref:hypothetical protein n=1 Tax=Sphingomonas sp. 2R-10 TaxID=3045148 RepID=UPI0024BBB7C1|nr:hypothetical protein [Sphingomonas sp. 2R-10]MDJ0277651.1 hypothetical protein [Sphingomonas sp. 2R-10]